MPHRMLRTELNPASVSGSFFYHQHPSLASDSHSHSRNGLRWHGRPAREPHTRRGDTLPGPSLETQRSTRVNAQWTPSRCTVPFLSSCPPNPLLVPNHAGRRTRDMRDHPIARPEPNGGPSHAYEVCHSEPVLTRTSGPTRCRRQGMPRGTKGGRMRRACHVAPYWMPAAASLSIPS